MTHEQIAIHVLENGTRFGGFGPGETTAVRLGRVFVARNKAGQPTSLLWRGKSCEIERVVCLPLPRPALEPLDLDSESWYS